MILRLLLIAGLAAYVGAQSRRLDEFKWNDCYPEGEDVFERMPLNLDNLIALIEKLEREENMEAEEIARVLLGRFRVNGIQYNENSETYMVRDRSEADKEMVEKKILDLDTDFNYDLFTLREKCSVHRMISHAIDPYPRDDESDIWDGSVKRSNSYGSGSSSGSSYGSNSDRNSNDDVDDSSSNSRYGSSSSSNSRSSSSRGRYRRSETLSTEVSQHPIEYGVIDTPSGPVAAGTLLAGLVQSQGLDESVTLSNVYSEPNDMPDYMKKTKVNRFAAVTLAGDIAQESMDRLTSGVDDNKQDYVSTSGMFANSTVCPRSFSMAEPEWTYLTRAEIFAGIDAALISKSISEESNLMLSQALRLYYSEHGLPGFYDFRACNRKSAFKSLNPYNKLEEQVLYTMYAYSESTKANLNGVEEEKVEKQYQEAIDDVFSDFKSFMNYDDVNDYERCPDYNSDYPPCEGVADVVFIYSREGGGDSAIQQREIISMVARQLGVGYYRSRIGVMDGGKPSANMEDWVVPLTNISNVADFACNFTQDSFLGLGGSMDMLEVAEAINVYYRSVLVNMQLDQDNFGGRKQILIWGVDNSFDDQDEVEDIIHDLMFDIPDLRILLVGRNRGTFEDILQDPENDFFSISGLQDPYEIAPDIVRRICQAPTLFTYPRCNTEQYPDDTEDGHQYEGVVSPNFTTFLQVSPTYFFSSNKIQFDFNSRTGGIEVCTARDTINPIDGNEDTECYTSKTGEIIITEELCFNCPPIYFGVTGISEGSCMSSASDDVQCEYPNQIEFTMNHDGLRCGCSSIIPSLTLLLLAAFYALIR